MQEERGRKRRIRKVVEVEVQDMMVEEVVKVVEEERRENLEENEKNREMS